MNLSGANILIAAQYAAPYEGNFIASLRALKNKLCSEFNARCAFVFPKSMERQQWAEHFINENIVFLTGDSFQPITKSEATEIVSTFQPDLIYTHFEGYDSMMARAAFRSPKTTRIVWHMHDTLGFQKHPLKALYQFYCFVKHYGIPFAAAGITRQQGGGKTLCYRRLQTRA